METRNASPHLVRARSFTGSGPRAYEFLAFPVPDMLPGDADRFLRRQEVEESWGTLGRSRRTGANTAGRPSTRRAPGPAEADEMLARDGRSWRRP
ncbi:hypothetical protein [Streptomyces thermoalcalitolerans]|uniref:hypothetical protein n=1 Tax=Streptomyces thermoalcalitolerans TaxID=65605 RepID=UPI003CD09B1B